MTSAPDPNKDTHDVASKMSAGTDTIDDELKQLDSALNVDDAFPTLKLRKPTTGKPLMVIVACGSFSPITYLHLRIFEEARNYYMNDRNEFDVIGGIISPVNNQYPKESLLSGEHRMAMCKLATESSDWIDVSGWEVQQTRWVRTAVVLSKYHRLLNNLKQFDQPIHVRLLFGADVLRSFVTPNLWRPDHLETLCGKFGVACIERKIGLDEPDEFIRQHEFLWNHRRNISIIPLWVENNVSSSAVRRIYKRGLSAKYLLPDPVLEYIDEHKLYPRSSS